MERSKTPLWLKECYQNTTLQEFLNRKQAIPPLPTLAGEE
jgi:hypothetical protein